MHAEFPLATKQSATFRVTKQLWQHLKKFERQFFILKKGQHFQCNFCIVANSYIRGLFFPKVRLVAKWKSHWESRKFYMEQCDTTLNYFLT